tara:strand:+ start:10550 stop:10705 length:156 start_codon:yes stop_codon:yes gene_type:complete
MPTILSPLVRDKKFGQGAGVWLVTSITAYFLKNLVQITIILREIQQAPEGL